MSEVASSPPDGTSGQAPVPMSRSAKLCFCVCIALFAVVASLMSGFDAVIVEAVSACLADWRIPAGIGLTWIVVGALCWAVVEHPYRVEQAFFVLLCLAIVCCWPWLLSAKTNDGVHAISAPLGSAMILVTLLFATCAALHFGPIWGGPKRECFFAGLILANIFALLFSGVVALATFDSFERKAHAAARTSFVDLHSGEQFVDPAIVEMSGFKFECRIDNKDVSCRRVRN
jgi:hypothetical protein